MSSSNPTKTTSKPEYPAEFAPIAAREADLFENVMLPMETRQLQRLFAMGSPDRAIAENAASPQLKAAMQAAAAIGGSGIRGGQMVAQRMSDLPRALLVALRSATPEQLAEFSKNLIDPRFAQVFAPNQASKTTGGGPGTGAMVMGGIGTAAAVAGTVAMIA